MPQLDSGLRRPLIAVHRLFGQVAAIVVVVLALTGIAMNHGEDFEFLKGPVRWEPLLDWYGLAPEGELVHFSAGPHSGASLERGIYLDGRYLMATQSPLVGVIRFRGLLAFATRDRVMLVDPAPTSADERAQILDQMGSASLPGLLTRVGLSRDLELVVETDAGSYKADADLLHWAQADPETVTWSAESPASEALRTRILREYRGEGLPRTRVIADLHSGRIFGSYGPWLMDGSAVILLLLVATGIARSSLGRRRHNGQ